MTESVLLGFSGGVDSAVSGVLLQQQGYAVEAVFMKVRGADGRGCGVAGDADGAAALAKHLGIPFRAIDCSREYAEKVLGNFRAEYLAGRTPNPCVQCNPNLKFRLLPDLAEAAGVYFDRIATGHYARTEYSEKAGRHVLLRGSDHAKDQSYFLHRLTAEQLAKVKFPLGEMTKKETRALAAELKIPVAAKPDSQDFYGGDYAELLGVTAREGEIIDGRGKVLGKHEGYWRFTPGQRKGLGIAFKEPLYVIRTDPATNRVVVGTKEEELSNSCTVADWVEGGGTLSAGMECQGRIRSAQPPRPMRVDRIDADGTATMKFAAPAQGVAPGQSLVLYEGEMVIGGGVIQARW